MGGQRAGYTLVLTMAVLSLALILATTALGLLQLESAASQRSYLSKQALNLAEAGLDTAVRQLNLNPAYAGETTALGSGVFTVVVSGSGSERTIESTGYVPNDANPQQWRKIRAEAVLSSTRVEFFYGVQVDSGGLTMGNNARIYGNVYSNGNIIGNNGAAILADPSTGQGGEVVVAGGVNTNPSVEWAVHHTNQDFATNSNNRDIAQSFIATASDRLNMVSVYLGKVGSPSTNLILRITADNNNNPRTSDLANTTIAASMVGSSPSWVNASFSNPPNLTTGQRYWILLDYASSSSSHYWRWGKDASDSYANNTGKYTSSWNSGNPTWTEAGGDLAFRVWIGGVQTKIDNLIIGDATTGVGRANVFVNSTVHGSPCPNPFCIIDNQTQEPLPIPDGKIQDWKNDAAIGGTHLGDYSLTNGQTGTIGPRKITGKLRLSNLAQLTLSGTLWVVGDIELSNNCVIKLDPSYGANSGIIITDGNVTVSNNCLFQGSGTAGSYILLLSAKDSPSEEVMSIRNNSAGVIYYAGRGRLRFSNNATAKEATAWGITLENNATITYESGLANAIFTSGPGGGWQIRTGSYRELR